MSSVFHTRLNAVTTSRLFEQFQEDAEYRPVDGGGVRAIKVCATGRLGSSGGPSRRRENEQYHKTETSTVDLLVYEHSSENPGITKAKMGDVIVFRDIPWSFQEELSKDGEVFTIRLTNAAVLQSGRVNIGL